VIVALMSQIEQRSTKERERLSKKAFVAGPLHTAISAKKTTRHSIFPSCA